MTGRVLVAIDLSPTSALALREANRLAKATGKILGMIHVVPDFIDPTTLGPNGYLGAMPAMADVAERAREKIHEWALQASQEPGVELFVDQGAAATRIVERAENWGAELIVLGSQGHSGLAGLVLGSVARRVVHHAHCPVLVCRANDGDGPVLAATDLSDPSLPAIGRAVSEARWRQAALSVIHVVDASAAVYAASAGGLFGLTVPLPPVDLREEVVEALTNTLSEAMARFGASGEPIVVYAHPAEAIVRCARERQARLVVVGTHGRSGLARMALGSVADAVVHDAPCSVLVVRHAH